MFINISLLLVGQTLLISLTAYLLILSNIISSNAHLLSSIKTVMKGLNAYP